MELRYKKNALKALRKLPPAKATAITEGMLVLANDPFAEDNNVTSLTGVASGYRKRFGDIRVLYTADTTVEILEVFKIGSRGEVYKR